MPFPPPRLTVRVGITGHRNDKLNAASRTDLAREIGRVLDVAASCADTLRAQRPGVYADQPAAIRVVSALAEGADRIAARVALDRGHELACILPFMREEYEHDFHAPASIQEFKNLLHRASSVLELDGPHGNRVEAYDDVGRLVLRQCDVLIAVWDGKPATGLGGTAHVVAQARELEIPVVWVASTPPHRCVIIDDAAAPGTNTRALATLAVDFERILFPPIEHPTPLPPIYDKGPRAPWFNPPVFRWFRAIMEIGHHRQPAEAAAPAVAESDIIAREYRRADGLADRYASYYRYSFVLNYALGATAVGAALVDGTGWEVAAIAIIIVITILGWRYRWHERWLGCRLLAEQFRHVRFLRPIACAPSPMRSANQDDTADAEAQWGLWLLQARLRELPSLHARFDAAYLARFRDDLAAAIHEQQRYHDVTEVRNRYWHDGLHLAGTILFAATGVFCLAHIYLLHREPAWLAAHPLPPEAFLVLAAGPPALAAALAGINNHGEFGRVSQRSRAMARRLTDLAHELESEKDLRSKTLARIAEQAASMMSAELRDWQYLSWGRPITLPS